MYVPPDEPIQEQGEVNMTFRADENGNMGGVRSQQQALAPPARTMGNTTVEQAAMADEGAGYSSVNPIYQRWEELRALKSIF